MAFTLNPILKSTPRRDKTRAVLIRITKGRVHAYYTTGVYVLPENWNKRWDYRKANFTKGYPMAAVDNNAILGDLDALDALAKSHPALTAEGLRDLHRRRKENPEAEANEGPDFLSVFRQELARRSRREPGTVRVYSAMYNKLSKFCGGALPFERLDHAFVRDYVAALEGKGNKGVTIRASLSMLASVARVAMKQGLLDFAANPLTDIGDYNVKLTPPDDGYLDRAAIDRVAAYEPPPGRRGESAAIARDVFLVQFYTHGARNGDIVELRWEDLGERVSYRMRKNRKRKRLPLTPALEKVLDRYRHRLEAGHGYVFPLLPDNYPAMTPERQAIERMLANRKVNRQLRNIAKALGVRGFTSHMARHSFSNEAIHHTDVRGLQDLLKHSSVVTTERYLERFKEGGTDELTQRIYSE